MLISYDEKEVGTFFHVPVPSLVRSRFAAMLSQAINPTPIAIAGIWIAITGASIVNAMTNRMTISGMLSFLRSYPDSADEKSQIQKHVRATIQRNGIGLNSSMIRIVG